MIEREVFSRLSELGEKINKPFEVRNKPHGIYFDRDVFEYALLKKIMQSLRPQHITVLGGYTCMDLFLALEGIKCDITNYDPMNIGKFTMSQRDLDTNIYLLKKFFTFQGEFKTHLKIVDAGTELVGSKTWMINIPDFQIEKLLVADTETIIYSHYHKMQSLSRFVTDTMPKLVKDLPLRYVTPQMLIFSKKDFTDIPKHTWIEYGKDFFGQNNVHYINDKFKGLDPVKN